MRTRPLVGTGCLLAVLALSIGACGGNGNGKSDINAGDTGSTTLTIYSSLPEQGDSRAQSLSIMKAEKLALSQAGARVGRFTIKYTSYDNATAAAGRADPSQTSANARRAAQDRTTIAYLGEGDSAAAEVSVPILNETGILEISPADTYVGLTRAEGAQKGEPDKYYPSGKRTFGRVVPADQIQAAAQALYQKDNGCTRLYVLDDMEVYGKGLAELVQARAKGQGMTVVGSAAIDPKAANYRGVASSVSAKGADCVFFGGVTASNAVRLFEDLHAGVPTAKLFGAAGVAGSSFSSKLGPAVEKVTYLTSPTLAPRLYPPAGRKFYDDYKAAFKTAPEPGAIFGYEAMRAALLAIRNAGDKGNNRDAVAAQFFKIKNRPSPLGTYSIDKNGDTTLSDYGTYRVRHGRLVFDRAITPTGR